MDAVYSIVNSNVECDNQAGIKDDRTMHFDSETFLAAQKQLRLRNNQINSVADDGKYSIARSLLGKNLHTVQKFYAHSNWVELGNDDPADLIFGTFENIADNTTDTCTEDSEITTNLLTSGYYVSSI